MCRNKFKLKYLFILVTTGLAATSPVLAQSHVTIGGLLDTYIGSVKMAGQSSNSSQMQSSGMSTSYIGFNGTEDLGNGLKANFALNSYLRSNTGESGRFAGDTLFSRDAWIGLSGSFGAITLGRDLAPNFLPMIKSNPFGDSFAFSPIVLHSHVPIFNGSNTVWASSIGITDTGWSNQIRYTTPEFAGMTANLHYQLHGETADSGSNHGANILYSNNALGLNAYYENSSIANPVPAALANKMKTWMLGGSYDFKLVKIYASYSTTKTDDIDAKDKTGTLGVGIPAGGGLIMASWAKTNRTSPNLDINRHTVSLGYDYNLSKRTDLYTVYMYDKISDLSGGNTVAAGIRHRF